MANSDLTVLVLNLSPRVTFGELAAFFSYCGHVEKIQLQGGNKDRPQSALVTFRQPYAYQTALLLNNATFAGHPIQILPKKDVADLPLPHKLPNVTENNKIQGNIPVEQAVVQVIASEGIEKLNQKRGELEEKYKLSEKSRVLINKTRLAFSAADQAVSAAEEAAREVATRIKNTDYIAIGATWLSGVLEKTSKLVSEFGSRKGNNPNPRNHI
ncbi:hypothetical protein REPUB_Repub01dG0123300 [Reevesia pubescens]